MSFDSWSGGGGGSGVGVLSESSEDTFHGSHRHLSEAVAGEEDRKSSPRTQGRQLPEQSPRRQAFPEERDKGHQLASQDHRLAILLPLPHPVLHVCLSQRDQGSHQSY